MEVSIRCSCHNQQFTRLQAMEMNITQLCDLDPMLDDLKVLVRCISLWKSHPAGRPNEVWALDMVLQDPQGNRVQASDKDKNINKFQLLIDEGSCYRIGNFGVGDNGGKWPLLNHKYKMNFFKNTTVTRVANFDNNPRGFKFERFTNFSARKFSENEVSDIIGTVVSLTDCIPYNNYEKNLLSATPLFPPNFISMMISQKLMLSGEGTHLRKAMIHQNLSYLCSHLLKGEMTPKEFFRGAIKKMVGSIHEADKGFHCILYATINKIHREYGWAYLACKKCGRIAKEADSKGIKLWDCKIHKGITPAGIGIRYKVIVRVMDDTGSSSLLLFDDLVYKLSSTQCYTLINQYGENYDDYFPIELNSIVGKKLLFRFECSDYNINNNHHVYQVQKISEDESMIYAFKKDLYV